MNRWLLMIIMFLIALFAGCGSDKDLYKDDGSNPASDCQINEFYNGEECIIPTPAHIDYAAENSMSFELVNDDITYYYFIVQIIPGNSGDMGTYKIEYFSKEDSTPVVEEGLYTFFQGYTLERYDQDGNEYYWVLQQSGAGVYLYSVWHWEQTENGVESVYDTYPSMTFEYVIE